MLAFLKFRKMTCSTSLTQRCLSVSTWLFGVFKLAKDSQGHSTGLVNSDKATYSGSALFRETHFWIELLKIHHCRSIVYHSPDSLSPSNSLLSCLVCIYVCSWLNWVLRVQNKSNISCRVQIHDNSYGSNLIFHTWFLNMVFKPSCRDSNISTCVRRSV